MEKLLGKVPVFAICLGHQMIAKAAGAAIEKLKFGHRGGNHPVMNLLTGRVEITAQNHGFGLVFPSLGELIPELSGGFRGTRTTCASGVRAGVAPVVRNERFGAHPPHAREPQRRHGGGHRVSGHPRVFRAVPPRGIPRPTDAHYLFTAFMRLMEGREDYLDIDIAVDRLAGWTFGGQAAAVTGSSAKEQGFCGVEQIALSQQASGLLTNMLPAERPI